MSEQEDDEDEKDNERGKESKGREMQLSADGFILSQEVHPQSSP